MGGGWHFKGSTGPGVCHPSMTGAVAKKRSSTSQVFNQDNDPQLGDSWGTGSLISILQERNLGFGVGEARLTTTADE